MTTAAISGVFGPEMRTIPTLPRPGGVAAATMVSIRVMLARGYACGADQKRGMEPLKKAPRHSASAATRTRRGWEARENAWTHFPEAPMDRSYGRCLTTALRVRRRRHCVS